MTERVQTPAKVMADLKIQAMLFDMLVDVEALTLIARPTPEAVWLTRWKEKMNNADSGAESPEQNLGVEND